MMNLSFVPLLLYLSCSKTQYVPLRTSTQSKNTMKENNSHILNLNMFVLKVLS